MVAVAAGDGLARIFDSFGVAAVVHGGQTNNPSTGELLDAVEKIDADEVLLLPNNPNVILAARQATEMTTRRVRVVPTRNAAEGFAALLALDPDRDATANAEVMTLAGRAVQTLQVTEAVRDATIGERKVRKGQTIVLDPDDGLLAVGSDRMKAILAALEALEPGFELVTLYYGAGADLAEAEAVAASSGGVAARRGGRGHPRRAAPLPVSHRGRVAGWRGGAVRGGADGRSDGSRPCACAGRAAPSAAGYADRAERLRRAPRPCDGSGRGSASRPCATCSSTCLAATTTSAS